MAKQINVGIGANITDLQNGLKAAVSVMEKSGKDMSAVAENVSRLTSNNFKSISQAYRTTAKDAEALALHLGTDSEAFRQAAQMAQVYGNQLADVRSKIAGVDNSMAMGGVKNATTQFDALGFSVTQLTREMPAFAYSVQTGFMALSNNIPMFVDQIRMLKQANAELAASGQPVKSVFSQVASSFLSFNTVLSVGVTLLTVYGGKLFDYITTSKEAVREIDNLSQAQISLNKAVFDFTASPQQKEIANINKQYKEAAMPFVARLNQLKDEIKLENEKLQIIVNQEGYNQKILDRENEILTIESTLKGLIKAKNAALQEVNNKYREQVELTRAIAENQGAPRTIQTRVMGLDEAQQMASGALSAITQKQLDEGWAKINASNIRGMAEFKASWEGFKGFDDMLQASLESAINWKNALAGVMAAAGKELGAALMSGDFENVGKQIVRMLGGIATQIGGALIAMGIPQALLGLPSGFAYIAAGTALSLLGGVMSASGTTSNSSGGTMSTNGGFSSPNYFVPSFGDNVFTLDGRVRGQDLVIVTSNTHRNNRR